MDYIVSCENNFRFNEGLFEFLQVNRKYTLDKINDYVNTSIWEQVWVSAEDMNYPLV